MNDANIILTISIAAYNVEKYLKRCVESCYVEGDYAERLEVIIVNDGSTDNTLQIANELSCARPNIVKVVNKENGGYGSTINTSIKMARGKYFKLLDGDDWFETIELSNLLRDLSTRNEDLILMDYCERYMAEEKEIKSKKSTLSIYESKVSFSYTELNNVYITNPGSAIKTELLQNKGKIILENCFYTDHMFMFHCIVQANTITYLNRAVYQYRLGREGQSVSLKGLLNHMDDNWQVLKAELDYICENNIEEDKLDILSNYMAILAKDVIVCQLLASCSKEQKAKIKKIDEIIKSRNSQIYSKMAKLNKSIALLRLTDYGMYRLCHYNEVRKHI